MVKKKITKKKFDEKKIVEMGSSKLIDLYIKQNSKLDFTRHSEFLLNPENANKMKNTFIQIGKQFPPDSLKRKTIIRALEKIDNIGNLNAGKRGVPWPPKQHWTSVVKTIQTDFNLTYSQALKKWQSLGKPNPYVKKMEQPKKEQPKKQEIKEQPKKEQPKKISIDGMIKQEPKKELKKVELKKAEPKKEEPKKGEYEYINGEKWKFYGDFGINEELYAKLEKDFRKLFLSPGKVSNEKWAKIQQERKMYYEGQTETDYFPTPKKVVDRLMDYMENDPYVNRMIKHDNIHLFEPSAGTGSLIKGYIERFGVDTKTITANEYKENNILDKLLYNVKITTGDFLEQPTKKNYDLIIMNPPFNKVGQQNYYMEHIIHALNMLNRGGVMFVLCPEFHDVYEHEYRNDNEESLEQMMNKPLKSRDLSMELADSKKIDKKMMKRILKRGDAEKYGKDNPFELRSHQIRLLGYTSGEFDTISHEKKRDVYNLIPLNMKIAIYEIAVA